MPTSAGLGLVTCQTQTRRRNRGHAAECEDITSVGLSRPRRNRQGRSRPLGRAKLAPNQQCQIPKQLWTRQVHCSALPQPRWALQRTSQVRQSGPRPKSAQRAFHSRLTGHSRSSDGPPEGIVEDVVTTSWLQVKRAIHSRALMPRSCPRESGMCFARTFQRILLRSRTDQTRKPILAPIQEGTPEFDQEHRSLPSEPVFDISAPARADDHKNNWPEAIGKKTNADRARGSRATR